MRHSTLLEWLFITNTWSATWLQWSAPLGELWASVLGSSLGQQLLFLKSYNSSSHPATLEEIANTVINLQSQVAKQLRVNGQLEHKMNEQMKKIVALENDAPKNRRKILEK